MWKSTVSAILKRNYNVIGLNAIPKELKPWLNVVGNTNLPPLGVNRIKNMSIKSRILETQTLFAYADTSTNTMKSQIFDTFLHL